MSNFSPADCAGARARLSITQARRRTLPCCNWSKSWVLGIAERVIDEVAERLPLQVPSEVLDEEIEGPLEIAGRRSRNVRGEDRVRQGPERARRRKRLLFEDVEPGAGDQSTAEGIDERSRSE